MIINDEWQNILTIITPTRSARATILKHIEFERRMLRQLESLRPLADGLNESLIDYMLADGLNESLIDYMLADEGRHNTLLMGLIDLLDKGENNDKPVDAIVDKLLRDAHQPGNRTW